MFISNLFILEFIVCFWGDMMFVKRLIVGMLVIGTLCSSVSATKKAARPEKTRTSSVKKSHVCKKGLATAVVNTHRHLFRTTITYAGMGAALGACFGLVGAGVGTSAGAIAGLTVSSARYLMARGGTVQRPARRLPVLLPPVPKPVLLSPVAAPMLLPPERTFTVPDSVESHKIINEIPGATPAVALADRGTVAEMEMLIRRVIQILAAQGKSDGSRVAIINQKRAPGSHSFIMGDIHGTLASLQANLTAIASKINPVTHFPYLSIGRSGVAARNFFDLTINDPETNFIFLGDNADRGPESIDVWKTLFTFKIKYPNRVFLLRGNHETPGIARMYGLFDDWNRAFGMEERSRAVWNLLLDLFNRLPQAQFLSAYMSSGCWDVIQCCHGGIGLNKLVDSEQYTPLALNFLDLAINGPELSRANMVCFHLPLSWNHPEDRNNSCGFLWGDFGQEDRHPGQSIARGRIEPSYGRFLTHNYDTWANYAKRTGWLAPKPANIRLVGGVRGHEHHQSGVTCNGVAMADNVSFVVDPNTVPVFTVMSSALYSNAYVDLCSDGTHWLLTPHKIRPVS